MRGDLQDNFKNDSLITSLIVYPVRIRFLLMVEILHVSSSHNETTEAGIIMGWLSRQVLQMSPHQKINQIL
jgi:hypothetical protein